METNCEQPKFSVITPSLNQGRFIEEALLSVKGQNYPNLEHWVIDGGSRDGTLDLLRKFSAQPGWAHLRWVSEPDRGQSDALNKGFRLATGNIIGWLNADDRYRPGCFRAVAGGFQQHTDADLLYGDYAWIDENGHVIQIRREIDFSAFILLYHKVLYVPTTATFFRRRIFEDGCFLDPDFHFAMDQEYFIRLSLLGYRFQHVPGLLADFRWHKESKSTQQASRQFAERDRAVQMHSSLLALIPGTVPKRCALAALRTGAAAVRYFEKLRRGYYLEQWTPGKIAPTGGEGRRELI